MPNLGLSELIVIFMIVLLVFGGSRLPQIGEALGRTIRGFKKGVGGDEPEDPTRAEQLGKPGESASGSLRDATDADLVDKR